MFFVTNETNNDDSILKEPKNQKEETNVSVSEQINKRELNVLVEEKTSETQGPKMTNAVETEIAEAMSKVKTVLSKFAPKVAITDQKENVIDTIKSNFQSRQGVPESVDDALDTFSTFVDQIGKKAQATTKELTENITNERKTDLVNGVLGTFSTFVDQHIGKKKPAMKKGPPENDPITNSNRSLKSETNMVDGVFGKFSNFVDHIGKKAPTKKIQSVENIAKRYKDHPFQNKMDSEDEKLNHS